MNWSIRYATSKRPCLFCGGPNHWLHTAKEWTPENGADIGLPRPSVSTVPLMQPIGENAQRDWRKRVIIPWSARAIWPGKPTDLGNKLETAPAPHPEREKAVREEGRCAMCGDTFADNQSSVRFTGFHDSVESDHFPMHQKCMGQTVSYCPHMMSYKNEYNQSLETGKTENFEHGPFAKLQKDALEQTDQRGRIRPEIFISDNGI